MRSLRVVGALVLAAVVGVAVSGLAAATPAKWGAAWSQYDVTGSWQVTQSNVYHVTFAFSQSGTTLTGTATLPPAEATASHYTGTVGQITKGSLVGDQLDVVVTWPKLTNGGLDRGRVHGHGHADQSAGAGDDLRRSGAVDTRR